ncbi:MAG: M56 family metallopeptidase [Cytophagales bacterium]|nr:M56 family metallopeptidase [Cytophagales bacterium]
MKELLTYFLASVSCLFLTFAFFRKFFSHEKALTFNRYYLLGALAVSILLPLFSWVELYNFFFPPTEQEISQSFIHFLPELSFNAYADYGNAPLRMEISCHSLFLIFYIVVASLLGFRLAEQYLSIHDLIRNYAPDIQKKNNYYLVPLEGDASVFSFKNYLFWNDKKLEGLSDKERRQIYLHELGHIRQKHTYDRFFAELMCIVFWFNPFVWLIRKAIAQNHEYLADAQALRKKDDSEGYAQLLVKQLFRTFDLQLASYFNKSLVLQRIEMMHKSKSIKKYKYALVLPLSLLMLAMISCQQGLMQQTTSQAKLSDAWLDPQSLTKRIPMDEYDPEKMLEEVNQKGYILKAYRLLKGKRFGKKGVLEIQLAKGDQNQTPFVPGDRQLRFADLQKVCNNTIFTKADQSPSFKHGGLEAFYQWAQRQIDYPQEARDKHIEGKVLAEFVVEEDGTIDHIRILKGLSKELDQEAISVLKSSPKWNPGLSQGHPVKVRLVLPINFSLDQQTGLLASRTAI